MASLKDIRRRIGSVKNTQQITKAMKMVAAAKLRRAQDMISGARPFAEKIEELSGRLLSEIALTQKEEETAGAERLHPLLKQESDPANRLDNEKAKLALLIVSSDKGLCGAYNTNVIKESLLKIKKEEAAYEIEYFFVGRKAFETLRRRGIDGKHYENFWGQSFSNVVSAKVSEELIDRFCQGEFDRVDVVYTEFQSALSQTVKTRTILPIQATAHVGEEEAVQTEFIYKPNKEELLNNLLPAQVKTQMFRCFADSLASEFGSRMTSMDNATRNAKEMISKLTLEANRVRQASITNELMEIVSGAEALKG